MARKTFDDKDLYAINERFKEAFESLVGKVGRTKLAKEIGYNTTRQLYNIFDGNSLVPMVALYYLSSKYDVSLEWLFHGNGEMFKSDQHSISEYESLIKDLMAALKKSKAKLELMEKMDQIRSELKKVDEMSEDDRAQFEDDYITSMIQEKDAAEESDKNKLEDNSAEN